MTLEQLRIFIAVAEREHVTRAAGALNLTQSAVSAAIAALENRSRVALFHRIGRRVELSAEGRLFLGEARAVLAQAEAAERALADLSGLRRGTLAVEASQTIASYWLPSRLVAFRNAWPEIDIRLGVGNTLQVARAVREGIAELGFVEGHIAEPALASTQVDRDRLVIVVAPAHPWARKTKLSAADLVASEWVLREAGSGTRSEFEAALRTYDIPQTALDIALELPSNDAVRAAVESGLGATAISELAAASGLRSGALIRAKFKLPERSFNMLLHGGRYQSRAAQAFVAMITGKAQRNPAPAKRAATPNASPFARNRK